MNKKGMSMVVTTLIVILLVLVAVGVVWVVVKNILEGGSEDIELGTKCLNINVKATAVDCDDPASCKVTFERTGSNTDVIAGVKLVFFDEIGNSGVIDEPGNIESLAGKTVTGIDSALSAPNKIEVTAYFKDTSGKEKSCSTSSSDIGVGSGNGNGNGGGACTPECSGETPHCLVDICVECISDDNCEEEYVCGEDNVCYDSTCTPTILDCASQGIECGIIYDDCGNDIDCDLEFGRDCVARYGSDYVCNDENICEQITFIASGTIDNVWPPGIGIYFDDDELIKEHNLYYSKAAFFPTVNSTTCYWIVGYNYNPDIYTNAIVELSLSEPLNIATNDAYQIWDEMSECTSAL